MSAGVSDQRMKGQGNQVTNGPKDHVNEHEDFDSWRTHHQGYSTPISTSMAAAAAAAVADPYTYYGTSFPYHSFGAADGGGGTWSNGGGDPMTFLGGYADYMDGSMFGGGPGGHFTPAAPPPAPAPPPAGPPQFNYYGGGNDYSTWGGGGRKQYDDYYPREYDQLKSVEQSMQALSFSSETQKEKETPKKQTWAAVASQPAKPQPQVGGTKKKGGPGAPPPPVKHNMDIGTWETKNNNGVAKVVPPPPVAAPPPAARAPTWAPPGPPGPAAAYHQVAVLAGPPMPPPHHMPPPAVVAPPMQQQQPLPSHPILDELRVKNNYNPVDFDLSAKEARFFVIKSYSEDDIHRSIKYEIWCSTEHGNKRLDEAYREREAKGGSVLLFFSVNGSGHFCGMARMVSAVDYRSSSSVWAQDKWKGKFKVRWIYVKDVPNAQLRHIRLENNENKPVTNSRDTQEVPPEKGRQVLKVLHQFRHSTSIFDDFVHYEKRQEEEDSRKEAVPPQQPPQQQPQHPPPPQQQHQGPASNHSAMRGHGGHGHHKDRDSGSGGRGGGRGGRGGGGHRNN